MENKFKSTMQKTKLFLKKYAYIILLILCIGMLSAVIALSVINSGLQSASTIDSPSGNTDLPDEPNVEKVEFVSPVDSVIPTGVWGEMYQYSSNEYSNDHLGVDYFAEAGTEVSSTFKGKVVSVVKGHSLWGDCVEIEHADGIKSIYKGLTNIDSSVVVNAEIETGAKIGEIAERVEYESELDAHLHFEVMKDGVNVDPLTYFGESEK